MRQSKYMNPVFPIAALACLVIGPAGIRAANVGADVLISGVERRYNDARTLSADFTEKFSIDGRAHRPESGQLLLRKPGRMRWTYSDPPGKLFVSDGDNVYLYTAADNRVERSKLKASEDMRAPLAFLLGKLDLKREFQSFETKPAQNGTYLIAHAKNSRLPYEQIMMLIGQDFRIKELTVTGRDGSMLSYSFSNEAVNPAIPNSAFQFKTPAGADIVDAVVASAAGN